MPAKNPEITPKGASSAAGGHMPPPQAQKTILQSYFSLSRGGRLAAATFVLCTSAIGLYVSDWVEAKELEERKARQQPVVPRA
ncbi:hypothetical protein DL93DRAFT_2080131 [Clavulina sp. PMI_390]|nr:hypothetical protein DL93DRAFT_2080131 [Clavulina sp. PMI_390]